jgi:hypothetical protein
MSPFHQMSMLRKASFVQMERQEANAIIASGRRRSSKPLNPVGLALPREATEASKINGLRNRLEKNGFIILQGFSTEPPKWSQTHPNPQGTPQSMPHSREALFSYSGQPRSFEGLLGR